MLYKTDTDSLAGNLSFAKSSEKNGFSIQFYHVPTSKKPFDLAKPEDNGSQANFKAFLTDFTDSFKSNWNQKETIGRMDPIQTFKNTTRTITLGFDVPSYDEEEAFANFLELQKLIQMQYPVYEVVPIKQVGKLSQQEQPTVEPEKREVGPQNKGGEIYNSVNQNRGSTTLRFMSSPPILYIKFMNWIATADSRINNDVAGDAIAGTISDVSFKPDLDHGFYFLENKLIPKVFSLNLTITVIHLQELGWVDTTSDTGQKLGTHLFGNPAGISPEGFATYNSFPYNSDITYYVTEKETPTQQTSKDAQQKPPVRNSSQFDPIDPFEK